MQNAMQKTKNQGKQRDIFYSKDKIFINNVSLNIQLTNYHYI